MRCVDASKSGWYPAHHRRGSLRKEQASAKGAKADNEGNKDIPSLLSDETVSCTAQADFQDVRCVDASKSGWYPAHHRRVSLRKEQASAKGAKADNEGNKDIPSLLVDETVSCTAQTDFQDVRCIDASKSDRYPAHHRRVSLRKEEASAKGAQADDEGNKDTSGFQFKVFSLCYITSFDEVSFLSYVLLSESNICADNKRNRNTSNFQVKVFPLCYITTFAGVTTLSSA